MNAMESNKTLRIKSAWAKALTEPLDLGILTELHRRYEISLRADANYERLYDEQRQIYLAERREFEDKERDKLTGKSKPELAEMLGMSKVPSGWTRDDLVSNIVSSRVSRIESEHSRVMKIWAGMSEEEKTK